jgi:protein SCO1
MRDARTRGSRPVRGLAAAVLLLTMPAAAPSAHEPKHHADPHRGHPTDAGAPSGEESAKVALLDLPLLDVEGRAHRFRSEIVGDDIVAMDFIYTSCTTACPILSAIFAEAQDQLGDRLGDGVSLLSLSIDPATDVPARLGHYAESFEPKPGWRFLTGEKAKMDQVLIGLGAYTPDFEEHAATVLIGDPRSGEWRRLFGFPSPEQIVGTIEELLAARGS